MRKNICKHYRDYQAHVYCGSECQLNLFIVDTINFTKFLPCLNGGEYDEGCTFFQPYTTDELNFNLSAHEKHFDSIIRFIEWLKSKHNGEVVYHGSVDCPVCNEGLLEYSVNKTFNYSFGRCSSKGCMWWLTS